MLCNYNEVELRTFVVDSPENRVRRTIIEAPHKQMPPPPPGKKRYLFYLLAAADVVSL